MSAIFEPFCYVVWQWKSANLTQILSQVNILKTKVQLSVFKTLWKQYFCRYCSIILEILNTVLCHDLVTFPWRYSLVAVSLSKKYAQMTFCHFNIWLFFIFLYKLLTHFLGFFGMFHQCLLLLCIIKVNGVKPTFAAFLFWVHTTCKSQSAIVFVLQ